MSNKGRYGFCRADDTGCGNYLSFPRTSYLASKYDDGLTIDELQITLQIEEQPPTIVKIVTRHFEEEKHGEIDQKGRITTNI